MPPAECLPTALIPSVDCPPVLPSSSELFFKLNLAFYYKNFCCYKCLFCIVPCYKDTILITIARCFEMIMKAYETSHEKLQMPVLKEI